MQQADFRTSSMTVATLRQQQTRSHHETLAVANNPAATTRWAPSSNSSPEAMVKRGGLQREHERLGVLLPDLDDRHDDHHAGHDGVVNGFGGNCFNCHTKADPQWDLVCEQNHGCDPLPFTDQLILALQQGDPRP